MELESWSFLCTLWWNFREGYLREDESALPSPCLLHSACKGAPNLLWGFCLFVCLCLLLLFFFLHRSNTTSLPPFPSITVGCASRVPWRRGSDGGTCWTSLLPYSNHREKQLKMTDNSLFPLIEKGHLDFRLRVQETCNWKLSSTSQ